MMTDHHSVDVVRDQHTLTVVVSHKEAQALRRKARDVATERASAALLRYAKAYPKKPRAHWFYRRGKALPGTGRL